MIVFISCPEIAIKLLRYCLSSDILIAFDRTWPQTLCVPYKIGIGEPCPIDARRFPHPYVGEESQPDLPTSGIAGGRTALITIDPAATITPVARPTLNAANPTYPLVPAAPTPATTGA